MAEVTPLPALIASCSCQKTQAQGVGFGSAGARNYVWEHRASTSPSREGKNRSCQTELFNTLSCSVLAPHYSKTVRSLKYITHYFIPWKMLALQRAHLIKKNKSWFKYLKYLNILNMRHFIPQPLPESFCRALASQPLTHTLVFSSQNLDLMDTHSWFWNQAQGDKGWTLVFSNTGFCLYTTWLHLWQWKKANVVIKMGYVKLFYWAILVWIQSSQEG